MRLLTCFAKELIDIFGPFWDHMLGYWNAHLNDPQKVLFLKYEDLKEDITFNVKKIAEFIGCPFSLEEENLGKIEEISRFCSFESLSNLEVNKSGMFLGRTKNSSYFGKGEVGDWTNYLTSTMAERIKKLTESKLEGSGLMFKYNKSTAAKDHVTTVGKGLCVKKLTQLFLGNKSILFYFVVYIEKMEYSKCSFAKVADPKDESNELIQTLERRINWDGTSLIKYDGFWFPVRLFKPILSAQKYFKAKDTDIILSTLPKSGTTWLIPLTFCIVNRHIYPIAQSPLLTSSPHTIVPFLELNLYWEQTNPDLENIPSPRIFSTHMPYNVLPDSIRESECKIIYMCRNPLDHFISYRQFLLKNKIEKDAKPLDIDEAFDMFCQGIQLYGPYWEHVLGYWNAHLRNPEKVFFLKYEDLKKETTLYIKKIAEFIGFPFSLEEEEQGLIEEISKFCSFENLSNLEVNKTGKLMGMVEKRSFFRKGEVGDWKNYLTPEMAERVKELMENKLEGSGLMFKNYS
ncbi:hypothetical protein BUALT_Bualt05G0022200 [Buddleja alternifolia]|uniref:Sulfotransferase n=1 Tax=Buddleja alternifolia TaxID=168488 RepID=A0AAV6XHT5_9LAMI|nr:hypothetical protein BUALT_Bualt05G0022200 [Buddleja alternifolia]